MTKELDKMRAKVCSALSGMGLNPQIDLSASNSIRLGNGDWIEINSRVVAPFMWHKFHAVCYFSRGGYILPFEVDLESYDDRTVDFFNSKIAEIVSFYNFPCDVAKG